ncbi:Probable polygalacturonase At3g15720 [Linum grandiflorum]
MKSLYHVNSQRNHISLGGSTDVRMSNLTIVAPDDSPNTDGIDISHSSNVRIYDSFIGTGDDCIAINGFSSDINISRISCGPGHGISIGSLGKNGAYETVEDIRVTDSTFTRTQNCARIKTWKVKYNLQFNHARNPIIIDQNYMSRLFVPTNPSSDVEISDVLYREVYGSTTYKEAIVFICGQQCSNIVVENVNITSATPEQQLMSVCENGSGIHSQFVIPKLTCLH